jgi:hypothetical protein
MSASKPSAPRSRWRVRGLSLALGLVAAVVVAEIAARVALGPRFAFGAFVGPPQALCGEYDPELGWRNRANVSADLAARGFRYHVTLNSRGQRGPERELAKPKGVLRVVLLGDSTAWGWGVGDEQTWPRLVERELGASVEIVNLAVPGYGTDQELWALERDGLQFQPDLVLVALVHNDTLSNRFESMQGLAKPVYARDESGEWTLRNRPVPPPQPRSDLDRRYWRRTLSMYCALAALLEPPPPEASRYALDDPKVQAGIERFWNDVADPNGWTYMLLGRLNETTKGSGASLLAFTFPHLVDRYLYDPTTPLPARDAQRPFETYGTRKLVEAGRALGFECFSIDQALLDEVAKGTNLDCGDEHLNARGNEVVAAAVAARLREWIATRTAGR